MDSQKPQSVDETISTTNGETIPSRRDFLLLTGVLCNIPVILFLLALINRKMVLSEALGFIVTFLIIGSVFGFGFTLVQREG